MKKRLLSLTLIAALCLSLIPTGAAPALAAAPKNQVIYVGGQNVTSGGYWTTDSEGNVTSAGATQSSDNYIHYDTEDNILTLHNATIKTALEFGDKPPASLISRAAIGVLNQRGDAELTIQLEGDNTIEDVSTGIYVLAHSASTGIARLTITGSGSLDASGTSYGILVQSNSGNATLTIQSADVTAENSSSSGGGVTVRAGESSNASLAVEGGSLTATGKSEDGAGIRYTFGSSSSGSGTPSLTVSDSAIVKANGGEGGISDNSSTDIQIGEGNNSGGIVFDNGTGTVYGSVTLQEDLTIESGQTLDIPSGASLTIDSGVTLNNEGTVTNSGTLTNNGKIENSGTLPSDIKGNVPPSITTTSLVDGTVNTAYSATLEASGNPTSWEITDGSLPTNFTLNASTGEISGTPTTAETSTFTVTATNDYGSDSQELTLTIDAQTNVPVASVTLNKSSLSLEVGTSETLTATITPNNATNKGLLWTINNTDIIKFHEGAITNNSQTISAVSPGTATITVTAQGDKTKSAICTVTVTEQSVYSITASPAALNFGSIYDDQSAPAAQTVTITNTGNQSVTVNLPTSTNYTITAGTGFTNGTATLAPNATATFTVQPKAGLAAGSYEENLTISGTGGTSASVALRFSVRERPYIPPTPPSVSEETIDAILDAESGETVSVALEDGDTTLDAEVFETLAGQDITLEIALEGGVTWTVNGQDIPADANLDDLDLGVEMDSDGIPVDVVNSITGERDTVQMILAHDGDFGFTMTLTAPLGAENSGYWANLYHYKVNGGEADREDPLGDDEADEQLSFETAARIDDNGNAALPLSHASQYAIVIDDHSHATIDLPFSDVSAGDWFYDPVCYVYAGGLMTGVSDTAFAPEATTTRAMIVSMLARMENVTSAADAGFADVAAGDWYATAVNWAAANGIVSGIGDNTFAPNTAITREQLAAMLMNYAQWKGQDISARADLSDYTDAPSTWASEAVQWAVAEGLLAGVTDDQLQPQGQATRAQVAAIMQRFLEA